MQVEEPDYLADLKSALTYFEQRKDITSSAGPDAVTYAQAIRSAIKEIELNRFMDKSICRTMGLE